MFYFFQMSEFAAIRRLTTKIVAVCTRSSVYTPDGGGAMENTH